MSNLNGHGYCTLLIAHCSLLIPGQRAKVSPSRGSLPARPDWFIRIFRPDLKVGDDFFACLGQGGVELDRLLEAAHRIEVRENVVRRRPREELAAQEPEHGRVGKITHCLRRQRQHLARSWPTR